MPIIEVTYVPQFGQNIEIDRNLPVDRHHFPHGLLEYRLNNARENIWVRRYRSFAFYRFPIGISELVRGLST